MKRRHTTAVLCVGNSVGTCNGVRHGPNHRPAASWTSIDCVLVITDRYPRYTIAIPTYKSLTGEGAAQLFFEHVVLIHGRGPRERSNQHLLRSRPQIYQCFLHWVFRPVWSQIINYVWIPIYVERSSRGTQSRFRRPPPRTRF